jgi:hypothetical protein
MTLALEAFTKTGYVAEVIGLCSHFLSIIIKKTKPKDTLISQIEQNAVKSKSKTLEEQNATYTFLLF